MRPPCWHWFCLNLLLDEAQLSAAATSCGEQGGAAGPGSCMSLMFQLSQEDQMWEHLDTGKVPMIPVPEVHFWVMPTRHPCPWQGCIHNLIPSEC